MRFFLFLNKTFDFDGEKMTFDHKTNRIYVDLDCVLADFNSAAIPLMDGYDPQEFENKFGSEEFWKRIHTKPKFFLELPLMPDALVLYKAVKKYRPIILTGIPKGIETHKNQKIEWVNKHFGKEQLIVCCQAKKKSDYCLPGDVIVDDRTIYKHLWEKKGGIWITHKNAEDSIFRLQEMQII
jgi:5'(3')-deoxyribonucleotidase